VNVSVLPVDPLPAFAGNTVRVPVPFAALIVIDGEGDARQDACGRRALLSLPRLHPVTVAAAPAPPAFGPYVIVAVPPSERQRRHGDRLRCDGDGTHGGVV
jgi:hypothetical protein